MWILFISDTQREKMRQYIEIYMSKKKEEKREKKKIEKNKHVSEKNEKMQKDTFTRAGIKPERKSKKKQPKYKKPVFSSLSFPFFT